MRRNLIGTPGQWSIGGSAALVVALTANLAWSQVLPPVPPAVPEAVKDVGNVAKGVVKDAQDVSRDIPNDPSTTAQDAVKETKGTVNDVQKDAKDTVKDVQKDTKNTVNDAQKDIKDTVNDAQKDAKDTVNKTQQDIKSSVNDAQKDTKDTINKTQQGIKSSVNDLQKDAKDTGNNAQKEINDTANDAQKTLQNTTRGARDAAQGAANTARDTLPSAPPAVNAQGTIDARTNVRADQQGIRAQGTASAIANQSLRAADLGLWFDASSRNGLTIADVAANTGLAQAGFREGDRIVSLNGQPFTNEAAFVQYLLNNSARGRMTAVVSRGGVQQTLFIDPTMIPQQSTLTAVAPLEQFGIILDDRNNARPLVWRVVPRSPAFYAGVRPGDLVTAFANQPIANAQALTQLVQQTNLGATVPLQVSRNGQLRTLEASLASVQTDGAHTALRPNLDAAVNTQTNVDAAATAPQLDRPVYTPSTRSNARGVLRRRR